MTEVDVTLIPIVSGIDDLQVLPYDGNIRLSQNYPNPFSYSTSIKYYTENPDGIRIEVIDLMGKTVATLVDKWHAAGEYIINWNGTNSSGQKLPSGFYIYHIKTGRDARHGVSNITRKMLIR